MNARTVATALLGGAVALLAVGLVANAADLFSEDAVDAVSVAGLGLLAVGQGVRASYDRRPRSLLVLLLILALIAFVLID